MNAGTFNAMPRRSRPAFRWSAAPIIDGEIVGRASRNARRPMPLWRRTVGGIAAAALVLAALLCTLALFAFPGA